jgi:cytosine/adenosine deaminase-related metal-dependent hydrolase
MRVLTPRIHINSARSLGLEEEFGSIESGKTADLMILDGDPLEDFRVIGSRVAALFMDGKLVINNCGLVVESKGSFSKWESLRK